MIFDRAITAVSEVLINFTSQWVAVIGTVTKGLQVQSSPTLQASLLEKKGNCQAIPPHAYSPWVHTQVNEKSTCWFNMPPLDTAALCSGGLMGAQGLSFFRNPARCCTPHCPVADWLCFSCLFGTVRVVWPSVKWTLEYVQYFAFQCLTTSNPNGYLFKANSELFSWDIIIYKDLLWKDPMDVHWILWNIPLLPL